VVRGALEVVLVGSSSVVVKGSSTAIVVSGAISSIDEVVVSSVLEVTTGTSTSVVVCSSDGMVAGSSTEVVIGSSTAVVTGASDDVVTGSGTTMRSVVVGGSTTTTGAVVVVKATVVVVTTGASWATACGVNESKPGRAPIPNTPAEFKAKPVISLHIQSRPFVGDVLHTQAMKLESKLGKTKMILAPRPACRLWRLFVSRATLATRPWASVRAPLSATESVEGMLFAAKVKDPSS
jgi:hypothetical protein